MLETLILKYLLLHIWSSAKLPKAAYVQLNRQETADSSNPKSTCNIKLHLEEGRTEAEQKIPSPKLRFN